MQWKVLDRIFQRQHNTSDGRHLVLLKEGRYRLICDLVGRSDGFSHAHGLSPDFRYSSPDFREDPTSRSLIGGSYKEPLVAGVPSSGFYFLDPSGGLGKGQ